MMKIFQNVTGIKTTVICILIHWNIVQINKKVTNKVLTVDVDVSMLRDKYIYKNKLVLEVSYRLYMQLLSDCENLSLKSD